MRINAEKLWEARVKKEFPLRVLGEKAGISHTYVWYLEMEKRQPSEKVLDKLAEVLEVDKSELILE